MESGSEPSVERGAGNGEESEEKGFRAGGPGGPAIDVPQENPVEAGRMGEGFGRREATVDKGAKHAGDNVEFAENAKEIASVRKGGGPSFLGGLDVDECPKEKLDGTDAASPGTGAGRHRGFHQNGQGVKVLGKVFGRNERTRSGTRTLHGGVNGCRKKGKAGGSGQRGKMGPEETCVFEMVDAGGKAAGADGGAKEFGAGRGVGPCMEARPLDVGRIGGLRGKEGQSVGRGVDEAKGRPSDEIGRGLSGPGISGKRSGREDVVAIDKGQKGAAGPLESGIAGNGNTAVFGKNDGNEARITAEDLAENAQGTRIGPVENIEKFDISERLAAKRKGICAKEGFGNAKHGDDNGDDGVGNGDVRFADGVQGARTKGKAGRDNGFSIAVHAASTLGKNRNLCSTNRCKPG